jgi:hypothetical protein
MLARILNSICDKNGCILEYRTHRRTGAGELNVVKGKSSAISMSVFYVDRPNTLRLPNSKPNVKQCLLLNAMNYVNTLNLHKLLVSFSISLPMLSFFLSVPLVCIHTYRESQTKPFDQLK